MYKVQLPFGVAHLVPSAILGAEELSTTALGAIGVGDRADTPVGGLAAKAAAAAAPAAGAGAGTVRSPGQVKTSHTPHHSDPFNHLFVPAAHSPPSLSLWPLWVLPLWRQVFFGTHHCYVFMRLHHTLYTRLALARDLAHAEVTRALGDTPAAAASSSSEGNGNGKGQGQPGAALYSASAPMEVEGEADVVPTGKGRPTVTKKHTLPAAQVRGAYQAFLGQLFALVDGGIDAARYEEHTLLPLPQALPHASPSLPPDRLPFLRLFFPHSHAPPRLSLTHNRVGTRSRAGSCWATTPTCCTRWTRWCSRRSSACRP